jgi:MYXO-CTERM domain-containing protein
MPIAIVKGLLMLAGAFNDVPEAFVHSEIDFGGRHGVIETQDYGTLYLSRLVRQWGVRSAHCHHALSCLRWRNLNLARLRGPQALFGIPQCISLGIAPCLIRWIAVRDFCRWLSYRACLLPCGMCTQTLSGFPPQPLVGHPGVSASAMQLGAIQRLNRSDWLGSAHIWADNVTLVLPVRDYTALVALAALPDAQWASCLDGPTALLAGALRSGMCAPVVLDPAQGWALGTGGELPPQLLQVWPRPVHLASYCGWGMNATSLVLVPEQSGSSGADGDVLDRLGRCLAGLGAAESVPAASGMSTTQRLGAVVGGVVGGALLALLGLAGILAWRRRRRKSKRWAMPMICVYGQRYVCCEV